MGPVDTIHGPMEVTGEPDDIVSQSLRLTGEWAQTEIALFASLVSARDFVWDAGAFIGTFSLGVRQLSGARVLAIEPDNGGVDLLRRNLERNALGGFAVVDVAIGACEGLVKAIRAKPGVNPGAQRFKPIDAPGDEATALACTTLRHLRRQFGDYTALKLDIEGSEFDALRGDARFIRDTKPIVWTECNETSVVKELLGFFLWAELSPLYVAFPAFRKTNYRGTRDALYPIAYEAAICSQTHGRHLEIPAACEGEEIIVRPLKSFQDLKRAMWDTPRWGREEWVAMSRPELVARLGRLYREERFAAFLSDS